MNALLTVTLILSFWVTIPVPQSPQRTNDLMDMLHGQHEGFVKLRQSQAQLADGITLSRASLST